MKDANKRMEKIIKKAKKAEKKAKIKAKTRTVHTSGAQRRAVRNGY